MVATFAFWCRALRPGLSWPWSFCAAPLGSGPRHARRSRPAWGTGAVHLCDGGSLGAGYYGDGKPFVNWAPQRWNINRAIAIVRYMHIVCPTYACACFFGFAFVRFSGLPKTTGSAGGSKFSLSPIHERRMLPARSKYLRSDHGFRGVLTAPAGSPIASWRPPGEDIFSPCTSERIMSRYSIVGLQSYLLRRWDWGGC